MSGPVMIQAFWKEAKTEEAVDSSQAEAEGAGESIVANVSQINGDVVGGAPEFAPGHTKPWARP